MSDLSPNAKHEIELLLRIADDASVQPVERVRALLIAHQRRDVGSCLCGWDELGRSHAGHVAYTLDRAGLLAAEALP